MADRRRHQAEVGAPARLPRFASACARSARSASMCSTPRARAATASRASRRRACSCQSSATAKTNSPWLSFSGTGSAPRSVDAARHLAVRELERRVPAQEVARDVVLAEPQQRRRRQRAVADPRARVGARPGLQRRAAAVDEDVGERRAQRARDVGASAGRSMRTRSSRSRQCSAARASAVAKLGRGRHARARRWIGQCTAISRRSPGRRRAGTTAPRSRSRPDRPARAGAGRCRGAGLPAASRRPVRRASGSSRTAAGRGRAERSRAAAVDRQRAAVPGQLVDRARAARVGEKLRRRIAPGTAARRAPA